MKIDIERLKIYKSDFFYDMNMHNQKENEEIIESFIEFVELKESERE